MSPARGVLRGLGWGVIALSVFTPVLALLLWLGPQTPWARALTRRILEQQLDALLVGDVQIDRIEQLSLGGTVALGITVHDAEGRVVLRGRRLDLGLSPLSLLRMHLRFTHGRFDDVRIASYPSEQAAISLFEALSPVPGPPSSEPKGRGGLDVSFESIHVLNAHFHGDVPGLSGIDAQLAEVRGEIRVIDDRLAVRVTQVRGRLLQPYEGAGIQQATFQLHTDPLRMSVHARVQRPEDSLRLALSYQAPEQGPDHLDLRVALDPVQPQLFSDLGLLPPRVLLSPLRGQVHLSGPLADLKFRCALRSEAGDLTLHGALPEVGDTVLELQSEQLSLPRLIAYAPPLVLALKLDVRAPEHQPVRLALRAPELQLFGIELRDAAISASYADERLTFHQAEVRYGGGNVAVTGFIDAEADFSLRVRSRVPDLARSPVVRATGLRGGIRTDVRIDRKGERLIFDGSVGWVEPAYEAYGATKEMVIEGRAETDESFSTLRIDSTGASWGTTFYGQPIGDFEYSITGSTPHFRADFGLIDQRARTAQAHLELHLLEDDGYHVVLSPLVVGVHGREPWRARADVVIDRDAVTFRQFFLKNGVQRLDLTGAFSFSKDYRVDATLRSFDLGGLRELSGVDLADLEGTIDGKLALTGRPGHPRIEAEGKLRQGQFLGMTGLSVDMDMKATEARFDIDTELVLPENRRIALYAAGEPGRGREWLTQLANGSYQFGLDFQRVPFEVARPWLGWLGIEPPPGAISASVRGAGTLDAPELDIETQVHGLVLAPWPKLDLTLDLEHDGGRATLHELTATDAHGPIAALTGSIEATLQELLDPASLRASLDERPFELGLSWRDRQLDQLPAPMRVDLATPTSGSLRIAQSERGPSLDLIARLGWSGRGEGIAACGAVRHPQAELTLSAHGQSATGKLTVKLDDEQLAMADLVADVPVPGWVSGKVPLYLPRSSFTLNADTRATEEIPLLCELVSGPLRVDVSALDAFADPPELSVQVRSSNLQLVASRSQIQRLGGQPELRATGRPFAVEASAGVDGPSFTMQAEIEQAAGARLRLSGSFPRELLFPTGAPREAWPLGKLDLTAEHAELAPLLIALPTSLRVAGQVDGKAQARYDFAREKMGLGGAVAVSRASLGIGSLGQQLSNVSGRIALHDDVVTLESLSMRDFDGRLELDGKLVFEQLDRIATELKLRLHEFPIRRESATVSKLTGEMKLRATSTTERTRAELSFGELRVNLPNDLGQGIQSLDAHPDIAVRGQEAAEVDEDPYQFELHVLAKDPPFRVLRSDLSAEVSADLNISLPPLSMEGAAEIERGSFELYGKRFVLRESRVSFDRDESLDPLVSLHAYYKTAGDEIGVRVEGRLSDPQISFTHSNPAITDPGAIVAQLLGARAKDPTLQNADASGAAAGILAGATAGLLTQSVRDQLGGAIPVLSLESSSQTLRSARIRAGVQLDQLIQRLGPLSNVVQGAYVEGFVSPGGSTTPVNPAIAPQSRSGGLLELRFPRDLVGTLEYRPVQNWRLDLAWEP